MESSANFELEAAFASMGLSDLWERIKTKLGESVIRLSGT